MLLRLLAVRRQGFLGRVLLAGMSQGCYKKCYKKCYNMVAYSYSCGIAKMLLSTALAISAGGIHSSSFCYVFMSFLPHVGHPSIPLCVSMQSSGHTHACISESEHMCRALLAYAAADRHVWHESYIDAHSNFIVQLHRMQAGCAAAFAACMPSVE